MERDFLQTRYTGVGNYKLNHFRHVTKMVAEKMCKTTPKPWEKCDSLMFLFGFYEQGRGGEELNGDTELKNNSNRGKI